jgi:hypothetical protein
MSQSRKNVTKPRQAPPPAAVAAPAGGRTDYVPSPPEAEALRGHLDRRRARPPAPRIKLNGRPPQAQTIAPDHPDPQVWRALFKAALGTSEDAFAEHLLCQLLVSLQRGKEALPAAATINGALAALHGIQPRDEIEAMLATQMVATHAAALDLLGRTLRAEYRHTLQDSGNLAVKLLRTYAAQLEALQRYRGGGQQRIVVERVTVSHGGQAIVGHVEAGAGRGVGASSENGERAHAQGRRRAGDAPEPEVRGADAERERVPVAGGAG